MPRVTISVGDLKCVRQADSFGKDDVYWIANVRCGQAVDEAHTDLRRLFFDGSYATSLPEMVNIGAGQTTRFENSVILTGDCPNGSYVYGTVHFMERDTPLANYFAKIIDAIAIIIGGLVLGAVVGLLIGLAFGGAQGAYVGAILGVLAVGLVGFFVGAVVELLRPVENDAHLGGIRFVAGPLDLQPQVSDREVWPVTLMPSGDLHVVDEHGADLMCYPSSHHEHPVTGGHRYETLVQLEIMRGNL